MKNFVRTAERLWRSWWSRSGATGDPLELFREISARYSEPHRHYHTLKHIIFCLRHFLELREFSRCPQCVEAALWYHDIVYIPGRADNEEKSASIAAAGLKQAGLGPECESAVEDLILSTKHKAPGRNIDAKIIQDLDLAVLGMSRKTFYLYDKQIRAEYSGIPDEEFRRGRRAFLQTLLAREHIFNTDTFQAKYEASARENVAALAAQYDRN